jgi:hypothetical protein
VTSDEIAGDTLAAAGEWLTHNVEVCVHHNRATGAQPHRRLAQAPLQLNLEASMHRKRLVSWDGRLCGRTGVGVRSSKAAGHDYQSRPLVSSIHTLPLALSKTRTVTGATKPAQPKGGAGLASSHLQAGVIYP